MFYKKAKFWLYVGGAVTGLFLRSAAARKLAVNSIAQGMIAKDKIDAGIASIKEDANDIYEDAKRKKAEADAAAEEAED